jgi:hypothetical protein
MVVLILYFQTLVLGEIVPIELITEKYFGDIFNTNVKDVLLMCCRKVKMEMLMKIHQKRTIEK